MVAQSTSITLRRKDERSARPEIARIMFHKIFFFFFFSVFLQSILFHLKLCHQIIAAEQMMARRRVNTTAPVVENAPIGHTTTTVQQESLDTFPSISLSRTTSALRQTDSLSQVACPVKISRHQACDIIRRSTKAITALCSFFAVA